MDDGKDDADALITQTNLQGAIDLGRATIKSLILVNGVAAGGVLTFYGDMASKGAPTHGAGGTFAMVLLSFGLGVFFAVGCSVFAYGSQLAVGSITKPKHLDLEEPLRIVAIALGLVSALMFLIGVCLGAVAFSTL